MTTLIVLTWLAYSHAWISLPLAILLSTLNVVGTIFRTILFDAIFDKVNALSRRSGRA